MNEDTIDRKVIKIDEMATDTRKVTIVNGRDKYSFWLFKQDGNETKAYSEFKNLGLQIGQTIEIIYKVEDAEWVKNGKTIKFKRRTILGFGDASDSTVTSSGPYIAKIEPTGDYVERAEFEAKIKEIREAFLAMTKEVKALIDKRVS